MSLFNFWLKMSRPLWGLLGLWMGLNCCNNDAQVQTHTQWPRRDPFLYQLLWKQHPHLDKENTIICHGDELIFICFSKVRKHDFISPFFSCAHLWRVIFSLTFQPDINSFGPMGNEQWRKGTERGGFLPCHEDTFVNVSNNLDTASFLSDVLHLCCKFV